MLTSLSFIFLAGLAMAAVCQKLKLPRIIGMLVTGILLGPYVLNLLDPSILLISADLRQMALIIILIKAGLSLNLSDLKKVGRPAVFMSCLPASCEILGFFLFAPRILGITRIEAAVMGAVLGAVSPAVVIPRMVQLMDAGYGAGKSIPQLIMAGASCDDIFVIVLFSTFVSMAQGGQANLMDFADIPISIILGIILGATAGYMLSLFFERAYSRRHYVRNSIKVMIVLGVSFLLMAAETWLEGIVSVSGLLAVVSMACVIKIRSVTFVSKRLSEKFGKLWLAAEVILFVLVGAAVDIRYTLDAGAAAVLMILIALALRWRCRLSSQNLSEPEGASFLHHCLSSEGNGPGGNRLRSDGNGTAPQKLLIHFCGAAFLLFRILLKSFCRLISLFHIADDNIISSRSIGYHGDGHLDFLLHKLDVAAAVLGKVLIFLDSPDIALPSGHLLVNRFCLI